MVATYMKSEATVKIKLAGMAIMAGAMLVLAGCGGTKTVGTPASSDTAATPLAAVLDTPDRYDGQMVVLKGVLTAQCAALCDFTYSEGNRSVTIYTGDPKPPRIQAGRPVRVTVQVNKGEERVVLNAKGIEILPRVTKK